jgi:phosphoglycerol transferase MdoB-like AlkP superfamily enzyme
MRRFTLRMTAKRLFAKYLGPLLPIFSFFLISLLFLGLVRLGFIAWKWDRVTAVDGLWPVLGYGVRMDIILLSFAVALPTFISLLLPSGNKVRHIWHLILSAWLTGYTALIVFMEVSTPSFIDQYNIRPNRLFFEYLNHPQEVFSTLWAAYKAPLMMAVGLIALTIWGVWKLSRKLTRAYQPWGLVKRLVVMPLILLLLFAGIRSSFSHRPANMSTAAFCNDPLVNQLGVSSTYSLCYSIYEMHYESDSVRFYGKMDTDEVIRRIQNATGLPKTVFNNPEIPTLHRQIPLKKREHPLNLVIILEESLGAKYVQSLGGLPLTPELEKLSRKGLWFSQLYATGTRSARGIEAIVTGFPPTPSRSIVKLGLSQQNFFTIARLLKKQGYITEFIYGGDSQFDNMRGFLLGNGFDHVVDEKYFTESVFHGTWGVSDEDIFNRTHQEILTHGNKPFFTLVFSVSNHPPFEFPDGRIEISGKPKNTLNNAVKYADFALGKFFERAQKAHYWDSTLFLVVADHEDKVSGDDLVPVKYFHIPALIIGADVKPGCYEKVASQIDLPPTLLSIMGIESNHPMQGQDLLQTPGNYPGRAVMQFDNNQAYMVGDRIVIHTPNKTAAEYIYRLGKLEQVEKQPELIRDALAQAIWPSISYRKKQYRLDESK